MAAGRPIELSMEMDVSDVEEGARKVASSMDEVSDSLKEVDKSGKTDELEMGLKDVDKAADKAEDGIKKMGRQLKDTGDDAKKFDRDLTGAFKDAASEAKKPGKELGDSFRKGAKEAESATETVAQEAKQNLSETVSSFRGDAEDFAQIIQDIAGGVVSDLGPAGIALGTALAAGIGLGVAALQSYAEEVNTRKEDIVAMAQAMRDNGGAFTMEAAISAMDDYGDSIADTREWWEVFQSEARSGWEVLRDQADKTGLTMAEVFSGRFGNNTALAEQALGKVEDRLKSYNTELENSRRAQREQGERVVATSKVMEDQIRVTEETRDKIKDHIKDIRAAEEIERARREAIKGTTQSIKEQLEAEREKADGASTVLDSQQALIQSQKDLTAEIKENGKSLDLNNESGSRQVDILQDMAAAHTQEIDGLIASGATVAQVKDAYVSNYNQMRDTLVNTYGLSAQKADEWMAKLGQVPPSKITEFQVKDGKLVTATQEAKKPEDKPINLTVTGADGVQKQIASLPSDVPVHVGVTEQGTVGMTQTAIDSIDGHEVRIGVSEQGTAGMTQATIDRIHGKDVRVGATEQGTARQTQETIDRIHGKDVDIRVNISNLWAVQQQIDALTAPRSIQVTVNETPGRRVDH